jgi:hypothetical protein
LLWTAFCVLLLGLSHWYSTATSITRHVSFGAEGTIALLFGVLGSVIGAITMVLGSKRAIKLTFADGSMVAMPIAWYGEEEVEQFRSALSAGQKLAATPSSPGTPPPSNRGTQDDGELKTCPYCAEQIKAKAIKCKHCGQQVTV